LRAVIHDGLENHVAIAVARNIEIDIRGLSVSVPEICAQNEKFADPQNSGMGRYSL